MTAKYNTLSVRILGTQHVKSFSFIMDVLYFIKLKCMENQAHLSIHCTYRGLNEVLKRKVPFGNPAYVIHLVGSHYTD